MQLDMNDFTAWLQKSLCVSVSLPLPDVPTLTKYENHGVIQMQNLLPTDTGGKNFGRAVSRKKLNKTKPSPQPFQCVGVFTFPERHCMWWHVQSRTPWFLFYIMHFLIIFLQLLCKQCVFHCGPLKASIFSKSQRTLWPTVQASSFASVFLPSCSTHYSVSLLCMGHLERTLHLKGSKPLALRSRVWLANTPALLPERQPDTFFLLLEVKEKQDLKTVEVLMENSLQMGWAIVFLLNYSISKD